MADTQIIDFTNGSYVKLSPCSQQEIPDITHLLIPSETVAACFKSMRDFVVFTSLRLITVNVQGLTGKKKDYTSLPYSKITTFSVETAGHFDMDSELELWFSGLGKVSLEFSGRTDVAGLSRLIAAHAL